MGCLFPLLVLLVLILVAVGVEPFHAMLYVFCPVLGLSTYFAIIQQRRIRALRISDVDVMSGRAFELYVKNLLAHRGFKVALTRSCGDQGVDLIASSGEDKYAVQCKRHSSRISRNAVSDAVAGQAIYGCNRAMVITNSYFTPGAVELARANGCYLVDRQTLGEWIYEYQGGRSGHTGARVGKG